MNLPNPELIAHALIAGESDTVAADDRGILKLVDVMISAPQDRGLGLLMRALSTFPALKSLAEACLRKEPLHALPAAVNAALFLDHSANADLILAGHVREHPPNGTTMELLEQLAASNLPESSAAMQECRVRVARAGSEIVVLAESLDRLGKALMSIGRVEQAVDAARESVILYQGLMSESPGHSNACAEALRSLGVGLTMLGRPADAVQPLQDAIALYRVVPDAGVPDRSRLAHALSTAATPLSQLERDQEASNALREAWDIYAQLQRSDRSFLIEFLGVTERLATILERRGMSAKALPFVEEVTGLYRELAHHNGQEYSGKLAGALAMQARVLLSVGRPHDAVGPSGEAIRLYRELMEDRPDFFRKAFASTLEQHALLLSRSTRFAESLHFHLLAVGHYRLLMQADRYGLSPALANATFNMGLELWRGGRLDDAVAACEEAVSLTQIRS